MFNPLNADGIYNIGTCPYFSMRMAYIYAHVSILLAESDKKAICTHSLAAPPTASCLWLRHDHGHLSMASGHEAMNHTAAIDKSIVMAID